MIKKEVKIAGIVVLALIVIALIVFALQKKGGVENIGGQGSTKAPEKMLEEQTPEAAKATQELINEIKPENATEESGNIKTISVAETVGTTTVMKEIKAVVVAPGTSAVDMESGKVLTETGKIANNEAQAGSQEAPQQSFPIANKEELPKSTIKLDVTSSSFTPNTFTVNRGQVVSLAVSNVNETTFSEIFRFDDPSLSGVVLGLAKGETKTITFNAPTKAGEYSFFSDMFDHRAQGAVGKMIVK
jgi:hypothetical protein